MANARTVEQADVKTKRLRVRVRGAVQGVGFRPHVYCLADRFGLSGWVKNDGEGVLLEVEGGRTADFLAALVADKPPLARIDVVEPADIPAIGGTDFTINASQHTQVRTAIGPDAAVCPECLQELFDPADRRYRYAFLNCTHCGPRFTITRALPYDRPQTSMAGFQLCEKCAGEYADPMDRRFHAQPTCCPDCGPQLSQSIEEALSAILDGKIIALKGLGGFHLVCDARNEQAVAALRLRKSREAKPFAVMVAGLASARKLAKIDKLEARALAQTARPVVLCLKQTDSGLAEGIAPGLREVGLMLPHTPLQYLLFHEAAGRPNGSDWLDAKQELALVMTSANPGGEPLVIGNEEAREHLYAIADLIVDHDRDIVIRADDSVQRVIHGAAVFLRRGRGFTPVPIDLGRDVPSVLALGGHLKTSICMTRGREAFLSQHVGDMENPSVFAFMEETIAHMSDILQVEPQAVACDMHPDFLTSRHAQSLNLPVIPVQHHHAHIAAIAAEHQIIGALPGLALDGYGYGRDGGAWGGELLVHEGADFTRIGSLRPLALPGGDKAAREPWRLAASVLHALGRGDEIQHRFADHKQAQGVAQILSANINCPPTSSAGRLFDAASGLLGVCEISAFEGQAPMLLEALVEQPLVKEDGWRMEGGQLDFLPLMAALADMNDRQAGAELFHGTLISGLAEWVMQAAKRRGWNQIGLGGGCFLNRVLTEGLVSRLTKTGIKVYMSQAAPPGDGGLALGQALIATEWINREGKS